MAVAPVLAGRHITIGSSDGSVLLRGVQAGAVDPIQVFAKGDVDVVASENRVHEEGSSSSHKSGLSLGGDGLFLGSASSQQRWGSDSVTHNGAALVSQTGDVEIRAGGKIDVLGSRIDGAGPTVLSGRSIHVGAVIDTNDSWGTSRQSSAGLSLGGSSSLLNEVGTVARMAGAGSGAARDGDSRTAVVAGLAGGLAISNGLDDARALNDTLGKGKGEFGVSLHATLGVSRSSSRTSSHRETVVGSDVGGDTVVLSASGDGPGSTIDIAGSDVGGRRGTVLKAPGNITIEGVAAQGSSGGSQRSFGASLGVSEQLGLGRGANGTDPSHLVGAPTLSAGVSGSHGSEREETTSWRTAHVGRDGLTRVESDATVTLDAGQVVGERVEVSAADLAIRSRQDSAANGSDQHGWSVSGSLDAAGVPGVSGNVSAARASGTFASVHDQAGIHAGAGGYQVDVRHHTQLDGGAIESSAAPERNSFTTGTLGFSDIRNSEAWSSGQTSFGGGWGAGGSDAKGQATSGQGEVPGSARGGAGRVSAGLPVAMSARGSQTSVTRSAISPGTLTVTSDDPASQVAAATISRDPGAANAPLVREFDADKRAGLERGFETVRTLGVESTTLLAHRAEDDAKWREAHPDAKPSESPYATWGAGGTGQRMITAAVGAAGGDVGGSLGGLAQGAAATLAQGWATERVKSLVGNDDEHPVLRALAQGAVACAGSVAGGGSCGGAALGAATSVGVHELLKTGATPAVDADGEPLTQREAQRRDHLVATVAGATASMLGLDPGAAITAAEVESENNSTVTKHGIFGPETKTGLSVDDVYKNSPEFRAAVEKIGGLSKFAEVAACASSPQSCSLNEQQQNALDAYSLASQTIEGQNAIDARLCSGDTPLSCAIQKANAFNKTPEGVRLAGGIEAVGGTAGVVADGFTMAAGTAACPGSIGAGCGAAALAGINAATNVDRIVAGAKQAVTATPSETYGARAISSVTGASPAAAETIYGLGTLSLGLGVSRLSAIGEAGRPVAALDEGPPAALGANPAVNVASRDPTGEFYSVAFETRLNPTSYPGVSRGAHSQEANESLLGAMDEDMAFARDMQNLGINLERTSTGLAPRTSPYGWTWHHAEEPGVMQLVPRTQHQPGTIFQDALHPDGKGGYSIWGK